MHQTHYNIILVDVMQWKLFLSLNQTSPTLEQSLIAATKLKGDYQHIK